MLVFLMGLLLMGAAVVAMPILLWTTGDSQAALWAGVGGIAVAAVGLALPSRG